MTRNDFNAWLLDPDRSPLVMGVLNVTPDSFSDGGAFVGVDEAVAHAREMIAAGASVIDVGGESTRPGAQPVEAAEQVRRVVPVVRAVAELGALVSVDTTRVAVAEAALDAGASIVNDVSAGRDEPDILHLCAMRSAAVVLMHMQGTPRTMQFDPRYDDVVGEVAAFLLERADAARRAGVQPHRIMLDVGIGFGKRLEDNLALLRGYRTFASLGHATLLGTSRKGFIGSLTGRSDPKQRLAGTLATIGWGVAQGASMLRVHDVGPAVDVVKVSAAIVRPPTDDFEPA